jgi:hypothetical protein
LIYLLVVDVSSQVPGPGTILGAGALTYHKILIYNTTLTCPKQLKSHIDTATKTCGKSSASQCKHAHSTTSMLHCSHAWLNGSPSPGGAREACRHRALHARQQRRLRIVEVDGHAQARSGRTIQCFLTCQASAHRCGERGDMRMSRGHAAYDERNPPEDLLQLPSTRFGRLSWNLHRHRGSSHGG